MYHFLIGLVITRLCTYVKTYSSAHLNRVHLTGMSVKLSIKLIFKLKRSKHTKGIFVYILSLKEIRTATAPTNEHA